MTIFGNKVFKGIIKVIWVVPKPIGVMSLLEEESWTQTWMHTEKRPCEDRGRRWPLTSQGGRPQSEVNPADSLISDL